MFSLISVCVFGCSSFRQKQATVLFCVCEWCDVFMEPFLRMKFTSSGAFYSRLCVMCVYASISTIFEYCLLLFIIYFIIFAVLY